MTDQAGEHQQRFTLILAIRYQAESSYVLQINHHQIALQQRLLLTIQLLAPFLAC
jgi:hypothetical protein